MQQSASSASERDRAEDARQVDNILRTFINETKKFENRFSKVRDVEKMLAVQMLMLESLLNFRFRGATLKHEESLVALENVIIDTVATAPTTRHKKLTQVLQWEAECPRMTAKA